MPLPARLGSFNRRIPNPLIGMVAGRVPPLAIVEHVGRRSGRMHRTPVLAFPADGGWVIALVYGVGTDWVRNVMVADGCTLERAGSRIRLRRPRVLDGDASERHLPGPVPVALRALRAGQYLFLDPA